MHPLSWFDRPSRQRRVPAIVVAAAAPTLASAGGASAATTADCPWSVQPYVSETVMLSSKGDAGPAYEIVFAGRAQGGEAFYAFSLAPVAGGQADFEQVARRLEPVETPLGMVYRLPDEAAKTGRIYLVAAETPVDKLEQLGARITPAKPVEVALAELNVRGGTDLSGPLPQRSMPGSQIVTAELASNMQICAYDVAMR